MPTFEPYAVTTEQAFTAPSKPQFSPTGPQDNGFTCGPCSTCCPYTSSRKYEIIPINRIHFFLHTFNRGQGLG